MRKFEGCQARVSTHPIRLCESTRPDGIFINESRGVTFLRSLHICDGCGDEFYGAGLFCDTCQQYDVKLRAKNRPIKFSIDRDRTDKQKAISANRRKTFKEDSTLCL